MSGYWDAKSDQRQTLKISNQSQSSNKTQQGMHQTEESWKQTLASQDRPKSPKPSDLGITTKRPYTMSDAAREARKSGGRATGGGGYGAAAHHNKAVRRWGGNPS